MAYSRLTAEQLNILNFATTGHNVCIFGRAGVGKSTVVQEIRRRLQEKGKRCQIACSSGVACGEYHGFAEAVHSHYGLQIAELPQNLLLERSLKRLNIVEQIKNVDVLIWDEISMSSHRLLNIINLLHQETSKSSFPFGGIQVILVGDFWQVKPIRSAVDNGDPVYESKLFGNVFSHRFELTKVLRQEESEIRLKEALDMIRYGKCDDDTEQYLRYLSRDFPPSSNTGPVSNPIKTASPVHIFFKRLPAEVHNAAILASLSGPKLTFKSSDNGNAHLLDRTISQVLYLKPRCRVMLLYNINQQLKNGICGTFIGIGESGELLVDFLGVGIVSIEKKVWYKHDASGRIQASRVQFPLTLSYAITAHKSQGLTMNKIVVHCSPEFIPGQTYVAISRVKHEDDVRVVDFRKYFLMPPSPLLTQFATTLSVDPEPEFCCCRKVELEGKCCFTSEAYENECSSLDDDTNAICDDFF